MVLGGLALACGSPGVTGSGSADAPHVLSVVSGSTGEPVAAAIVGLNGRDYHTDTAGLVATADRGGDLDVVAPGFLRRQTRLREDQARITLWPIGPGYPAEYVRTILYTSSDVGHSLPDGALPLERIGGSRVVLSLAAEIETDTGAMNALRRAVGEINGATDGVVAFALGGRPSGSAVFAVSVDPSLPRAGATFRDLSGKTIVGGRIAFVSLAAVRDARFVCHELGHALGLQHSPEPSDLMHYVVQERSPWTFTANERLTIQLLLQRPPGNAYPDDDRGAIASRASLSLAVD